MNASQATAFLSSYDSQEAELVQSLRSLQSTRTSQSNELVALVSSGALQSEIEAQMSLLEATDLAILTANNNIKALQDTKVQAENVLVANNAALNPGGNPFVGATGPQGPHGPTGPASSFNIVQSVVAGSNDPVSSDCAYKAIQNLAGSSSTTTVSTVTVGTPTRDTTLLGLWHFNGPSGSTTFTESSGSNTSLVASADSKLSTAIKRFGTASLDCTTALSYVTIPNVSIGTQNFTIEFWYYAVDGGNGKTLFSLGTGTLLYLQIINTTWSSNIGNPSIRLTQGVWYHCAVCRSGTAASVYINGYKVCTSTLSTNFASNTLYIGGNTNTHAYGYLDELRITIGACRYTNDFNLPTIPYANKLPSFPSPSSQGDLWSDGTELYICIVAGSPGTWRRLGIA